MVGGFHQLCRSPRQNPPEASSDLRLAGFHIVKGEKSRTMWGKCGKSVICFTYSISYILTSWVARLPWCSPREVPMQHRLSRGTA